MRILPLLPLLVFATSSAQLSPDYAAKPLTRWWWFASVIDTADIASQLEWLDENGFGGVEIAWVYPLKGDSAAERDVWLSPEWSRTAAFAKKRASERGLSCDFTFGTLWPFGDSRVPPEDATRLFGESEPRASMRLTWEHSTRGRVINHLDKRALHRYAARIGGALEEALSGPGSALFCDSWEVETRGLFTAGFDTAFQLRFGYDLLPFMDSLFTPGYEAVFHDYMKLLSDYVIDEFYTPFTVEAHSRGAFSRAQCGGAPADLIEAFSRVDVPESEALLFEPHFSLIPASAAALSFKNIVTAESFTCVYGWHRWPGPSPHQGEELVSDLKLVADALFANGINGIIWHGMPYNPPGRNEMFYASVHVGPGASFVDELPSFNRYIEKVSRVMRKGVVWSDVAVYLPLEDARMGVEYPDSLKLPWAWGEYELRTIRTPERLRGYQPLWINHGFLRRATVQKGVLTVGSMRFSELFIDAVYLERDVLATLSDLAEQGLKIHLTATPVEPGRIRSRDYELLLSAFLSMPCVRVDGDAVPDHPPLVEGTDLPEFRARAEGDTLWIFFANPLTRLVRYPLPYGISRTARGETMRIRVNHAGRSTDLTLSFEPGQSLLLEIDGNGAARFHDIGYDPAQAAK